ncbi:MAG TPA: MotA/TolQ/ExbB proton channel family protein [Chitinophagales bacterium]|nr:MotA/TolQ/ExbB proton channel family protein [Chitinophagales bacterium]HRK26442.1 MotA/TolQ/ExbB proton channel family protein [Chitinophagales bacterium]
MKNLFALLFACGLFLLAGMVYTQAQGDTTATNAAATTTTMTTPSAPAAAEEQPQGMALLKKYFIEGGWQWMSPVLFCLIIGLAIAIERVLVLNLSTTNTTALLKKLEAAFQEGNVDKAKEICRSTRGPVASLFLQGLERTDEGIDIVEKSIVSSGSVEMGKLESGLTWISLFIALAPMLGFMGTVIGMIQAFDSIEAAGDISPGLVAGGIKVALLTTVFGLIVAIILQIFYNYFTSKVDGIVNKMEEASITFIDLLKRNKIVA